MVVGFAIAGKSIIFLALIVFDIIYVIIFQIIRFSIKSWINSLLPTIIVVSMIMVFGL